MGSSALKAEEFIIEAGSSPYVLNLEKSSNFVAFLQQLELLPILK